MSAGTARRATGTESARKTLQLLMCFSPERPVWTVAQLSERLGISLASAYRYVSLLREVGLVDSAESGSRYRVTDRAGCLARAARAWHLPLREAALPVLTRVRDRIDETVLIAARSGDSVFCVERVESSDPVPLQFDTGQPMALHRGALARVLLAAMPREERDGYLARVAADGLAPSAGALDAVRNLGYTESFEEIDEGVWGVAAAVRKDGAVVASLGTAAPIHRNDAARRAEIVKLIIDAAREVSRALAGTRP